MPYHLHLVTACGTRTVLEAAFGTVEEAMTTACAALRHGATDVWVEDDEGQTVADFDAIKEHCGTVAPNSSPNAL